jgi:hypothetical protein
LALLARLTVAVIGASGTGSLICELLARAGCRRILVIDHDIVKLANLNRILYATKDDARLGRPKAEVLKRGIESLELGCEVVPIVGYILDDNVMRRLNEVDIAFGCVDKDYPRILHTEKSPEAHALRSPPSHPSPMPVARSMAHISDLWFFAPTLGGGYSVGDRRNFFTISSNELVPVQGMVFASGLPQFGLPRFFATQFPFTFQLLM